MAHLCLYTKYCLLELYFHLNNEDFFPSLSHNRLRCGVKVVLALFEFWL